MVDGYGVANGFEIHLQDKAGRTPEELGKVARDFMDALLQRPEIATAYTTYNVNFPQYLVEVDAARCLKSGTTADAILSTLSGYYGGQYVSNFNRFSKLYRVMIQASPSYRETPESLTRIYTKAADGKTAPLSEFVKLTKCYGPESLNRFNLYNSMSINGAAAESYSSGDAIRAIRETAQASLPKGYGVEFSGISREESGTGNNTAIIFALCFIFVYLILCALYESFFIPFSVMLPVPAGLLGSFLLAKAAGLENNIYLQTGLIMLIGFFAKTAILLTGYATERRHGHSPGCHGGGQGAPAAYPDDGACHGIRHAAAHVLPRRRGERQQCPQHGCCGRHAARFAGSAAACASPLHCVPAPAREGETRRL